jgi:hypothetical protein
MAVRTTPRTAALSEFQTHTKAEPVLASVRHIGLERAARNTQAPAHETVWRAIIPTPASHVWKTRMLYTTLVNATSTGMERVVWSIVGRVGRIVRLVVTR